MENINHIIIPVKNWPNDLHANCKPHLDFNQYLKVEKPLVEENYNVMKENNLFEELEVDGD